jgi:hypothetical protein
VHFFAARKYIDYEFAPATVRWELGTTIVEVSSGAITYRLNHHQPIEIAKSVEAVGANGVLFRPDINWLKIPLGSGGVKFFNLSPSALGNCLEFA